MSKVLNELRQSESNHFQEELAKTYFSTDTSPILKNKKRRHVVSMGIFLGLFAILLVAFFIFNRVVIDIWIMPAFKTNLPNDNKIQEVIYLDRNGELNTELIKDVIFYENSNKESRWGKEFIVLSNEIPSKKAVLGINFVKPLNFKENLFCFYSKGKIGTEDLRISLRDNKNNLCHSKVNELKDSWQQFVVNLEEAQDLIDSENITRIDLEVNPVEKERADCTTIFFKEIYLAKRRD